MDEKQASELRKPFPKEAIGRLPKGGVMLDYVGHAAITDRLLAVDSSWSWEPVAFDERGLPRLDEHGGLWIRLTVAGVTRLGYGDAGGKKGPNAVKEAIGDALRNAAMRFGVALDLWAKEDLSAMHTDQPAPPKQEARPPQVNRQTGEIPQSDALQRLRNEIRDIAQARAWQPVDLGNDYSRWARGSGRKRFMYGDALVDDLTAYRAYLDESKVHANGAPA